MAVKETTVAVWSQAEPEVTFSAGLSRDNTHARRAPYRVLPADFGESLDVDPEAFDAILRVYPAAIEVGTVRGEYAKHLRWTKFSAFAMWSVSALSFVILMLVVGRIGASVNLASLAYAALLASLAYGMFCMGFMYWRSAHYQSLDDPVLFCRASKSVYVMPYIRGGFFRFWEVGRYGEATQYRWSDQIRARIYRYIYFRGGNLASEGFELGLLTIREGSANEVDNLIQLGVQSNGFDSTQLALWEHIRQYMEEDGPPLQPGDKLRATDLSRVPQFPAEIIEEAGGPALGQDAIDRLVQLKRRQ